MVRSLRRITAFTLSLVPVSITLAQTTSTPGAPPDITPDASIAYADVARFAAGPGARTILRGVELPDTGLVDLELERFEVLTSGATLVVAGLTGDRELPRPDLVLLRGSIVGDANSKVFLGVSRTGTHGFIQRGHEMLSVSTGPYLGAEQAPGVLRIINPADLDFDDAPLPACGTTPDNPHLFPFGLPKAMHDAKDHSQAGGVAGGAPCRVARIAVETDWEFTSMFGGDTNASAAYALMLIGAVGEIYTEDVNVRFLVNYLRVWSDNSDPYPGSGDLLPQFVNHWRANFDDVERETAHILSGRSNLSYGGVAYLGALCTNEWAYGVSAHLNGSFPYPLEDNHGGNWDPVVVAHELGHNFGTSHTHNYNPPIDNCGNGDCTGAENGTIMSYCHTCPGGMTNIALNFHPIVANTIVNYMNGLSCDFTASGADAVDDIGSTFEGAAVTIDVLLNDLAASCEPAEAVIDTFDAISASGGTIELLPPDGEILRERLRYTPAGGYTGDDTFGYTLVSGAGANVAVNVQALRQPDVTGATNPGVEVAYYALSSPNVLPNFDAITAYAFDIADRINYPSTGGAYATSGRADEVGAVYIGYITVPADGLYTLYANSDDGSTLYIGDELIVNNDGLHGMVEKSGTIPLAAGAHETRVEFFENGGGAGLIVSIAGPTLSKQVVPASMFSYGQPCPADLDGDGVIGADDLAVILGQWGETDVPADLDGGGVGPSDLAIVLGLWGPCT